MLAIGTHALFEDEVLLPRLGLAIVDEQHRFGVAQRLKLRGKAMGEAHQLMMSATPIPRTLAMTFYADLDVSAIDEMPPGRTPVATRLVNNKRRGEVIERVRRACAEGRQAYWVCPLIEESEKLELQTAVALHAELTAALPEFAVGLLHGRMKPDDKAAVMAEFVAGKIHVLVATTVIEVGVDVPNASLMAIEHAERFGLAQLHQLRGRVGRGAAESTCYLLFEEPLTDTAKARLKVVFENTDGFEIARQDLVIRGPGEFLGAKQSGVPLLRFADLEKDVRADREGARCRRRAAGEGAGRGRGPPPALAGRAGGVLQGVAAVGQEGVQRRAPAGVAAGPERLWPEWAAGPGRAERHHPHCQLQIVDNLQKPRFNAAIVRRLLRRARTATRSREDANRRWRQATQRRWT